ncbi:MAG: DUF2207 domain-containing protein [Propionibacteriaceae bacterium]|jgi:uncharacterized protein (TIGR04222 family)|nr:DUF2207 domain-containing protein [Propionibacteriaceae bacterium]
MMELGKRVALVFHTLMVAILLAVIEPLSVAYADGEVAEHYDAMLVVEPDGTIHVTETITFTTVPAELVQQLALSQEILGSREYRFTLTNITVTGGEADVVFDADRATITIAPREVSVVIKYDVAGAAFTMGRGSGGVQLTEVSWSALQGLSVAALNVTGSIVPGGDLSAQTNFQFRSLDCVSGTVEAQTRCDMFGGGTHDHPYPYFSDGSRAAGEVVIFGIMVDNKVIAANENIVQLWTLGRAFSANPVQLLAALATLLIGGVLVFALLKTKDNGVNSVKQPMIVASFLPTGVGAVEFQVASDVRPGHVGTVADERVDPIDITATVLDLAVRGQLRIVEVPGKATPDWTFERLASTGELAPFERTLLDAIAPLGAPAVTVSTISGALVPIIGEVQSQLYDDVVARGWFSARPDSTRNRWAMAGLAVMVLAFGVLATLVMFTKFGLVGIALLAAAAGFVVVSYDMPRRTPAGSALLAGLQVLATTLRVQPLDQIEKTKVYAEISEVLPYAVVLGSCERWTSALAAVDGNAAELGLDSLPWYRAGDGWSLNDFPASFDAFITAMQGRLFGRG